MHSWSFHQLGQYIEYRARRAGVPLVYADPAYTSQQCSECGHTDRGNRPSQATFACRSCGALMHAERQRVPQHRPQGRDRADHGA
ncbi:zinc ribbon domain-containing protein [Streptomyces sp. NPDC090021]|uniref:zinc ribbon domain-containing protein n=1 Tax=Streptomyces sp. NPDC090021 TaxID=3365919 RepID=UPI00381B5696